MEIKLNYRERGVGDPLVLLHGNGESLDYFCGQIDCFSASRRVIAVDTRGHGASPRGTAPFQITQFARDLGDFLDGLHIWKTDLLGFSDGGNIALTFALDHPERVRRLILNGANLDPGGVYRWYQFPVELGCRFACFMARWSGSALRKAELLGLMVNEPHIAISRLAALDIPTLVIAGTRDMIRDSHTREIAEALPKGKLILIPGDHFIASKQPEAFNAAVEKFLQET